MALKQTPSQTVGPFFAYGLTPEPEGYPFAGIAGARLAGEGAEGERIVIEGQVFDGEGQAVPDAMIEIWQADARGRVVRPSGANAAFTGFGRCGTGSDEAKRFRFETVKPGALDAAQAPHITVVVFMRGLLSHAYTRLYFADETEANARDPVLANLPAERRDTLIASREETAGAPLYRFDIRMQGPRETVFFDL